jgi:hypothetical protein
MDLTDEQWALLQPLIPPPSPSAGRGRPLIDERLVLNGILWKLRSSSPWYDMPSCYPSHQTCYRRYCQWKRLGILTAIYRALYLDLRDRGGLDLQVAFTDGTFRFERQGVGLDFVVPPDLVGAWQLNTALLFIAWLARELKPPRARDLSRVNY